MNRFALLDEDFAVKETVVPVFRAKKPELIPQVCVLPFEVKLEAGGPTGQQLILGTYRPVPLPVQAPAGPRKAVYRSQLNKPPLVDLSTDLSPSLFPQLGDCRSYGPGIWGDITSVHAAVDIVDPSIAIALARNVRLANTKALAAQYRDVVYLDDLDLPAPVRSLIEVRRARVVTEEYNQKMKHQPQRHRPAEDEEEDPEEICIIGGGRIIFNPSAEFVEPDDAPVLDDSPGLDDAPGLDDDWWDS